MATARFSNIFAQGHLFNRPRLIASTRPAGAKKSPTAVHRPALSTSNNAGRNGKTETTDREIPALGLKQSGLSRQTRLWLAGSFLTLGFIEGAAWVKFWPKVTGRDQQESSS